MYGSPAIGQFRDAKRSDHPVSVEFIILAQNGRFWAMPVVGYLALNPRALFSFLLVSNMRALILLLVLPVLHLWAGLGS